MKTLKILKIPNRENKDQAMYIRRQRWWIDNRHGCFFRWGRFASTPCFPSWYRRTGGEQTRQTHDMIAESPHPNDSTNLPPSLDCLNQISEHHNSGVQAVISTSPDSFNLTVPPGDFMKNQEDSNNEIQFSGISYSSWLDQDLNESLPPPPAEL